MDPYYNDQQKNYQQQQYPAPYAPVQQQPLPGYPPPQGNQGYYPGQQPPPANMYPPPANMYPPTSGSPMMPAQQAIPAGCPPGLEYLAMVDQLLVHQKIELLEVFTGFETNNKYAVRNSMGQNVYFAAEDTDCCTRNCCGPSRPFDMKIMDNSGREVIHLYRPLRCSSCLCPCCLQELEVSSPPGNIVGYVTQNWSCCSPEYSIQNASRDTILKIQGPCCTISCCGDVNFEVLSADGDSNVGRISKQWSGLAREMFTDADNFGITFPMDLDVKMKAVMLGACFLIDFMFFEKTQNKEQDGPGML